MNADQGIAACIEDARKHFNSPSNFTLVQIAFSPPSLSLISSQTGPGQNTRSKRMPTPPSSDLGTKYSGEGRIYIDNESVTTSDKEPGAVYEGTAFDYERRIRQEASETAARRKVGLRESQGLGMGIVSMAITQRQYGGFGNVEEVLKKLQDVAMHSVYAVAMQRKGCRDRETNVIKWITPGCVWVRDVWK
ncbi:hypothetical protein Q9L58_009709 [Maublancomyces gigas]|uniref:Uncharacterized protein n=1 Tax=Discina gigas TaxID=1032678 RepID=A0ABR3G680_9PEZI